MTDRDVLVAYSSQSGSTAEIAEVIAKELRRAGLAADCRQASAVGDIEPYGAVILGSGVFLARRGLDGGGFLARHAMPLASRRVWLFASGPIGREHDEADGGVAGGVMAVAQRIGAEGAAAFGALAPTSERNPLEHLVPIDLARVRTWARAIANDLAAKNAVARPADSVAAVL